MQPDLLRSDVRVEDLDGTGEAYPHVYGPLGVDAVVAVTPPSPWTGRPPRHRPLRHVAPPNRRAGARRRSRPSG
ncbi:MAG: DUF952 domain-containing protein [Jiangellaceae bacterium]